MNNAPAFQHYPSDFLSHPIVALMTTTEIGALWLLINYAWKLGELPNDIEELSSYTRLTVEQFEPMWNRRIKRYFQLTERDTWIDRHLELQKIKHSQITEVRQKASEARWGKQKDKKSNANAMQMESFSSSSSISTSKEKEETSVSSKKVKGCRIPDDFYPSDEMIAYALEKIPDIDLETRIKEFKNYWKAKTGRDATKTDWNITFQNRIIQILDYKSKNGVSNGKTQQNNPKPSNTETVINTDLSDLDRITYEDIGVGK